MMKRMKLMTMMALAATFAGCMVTKVEYEQNAEGETRYRIYRNGHWLKTEAEGLRGGMRKDGGFEIAVDGIKQSPSEEFGRTMQIYTQAFTQLASIAAAAFNPSASAALSAATALPAAQQAASQASHSATAQTAAAGAQPASADPCPDCVRDPAPAAGSGEQGTAWSAAPTGGDSAAAPAAAAGGSGAQSPSVAE